MPLINRALTHKHTQSRAGQVPLQVQACKAHAQAPRASHPRPPLAAPREAMSAHDPPLATPRAAMSAHDPWCSRTSSGHTDHGSHFVHTHATLR